MCISVKCVSTPPTSGPLIQDSPEYKGLEKQVVVWIIKTLEAFFNSDHTEAEGFAERWTYYPAKLWAAGHDSKGVPKNMPRKYGTFYVECAKKLWERMKLGGETPPEFITYSSILKQAQLQSLQVC